jgi:hypothetical protein
MKAQRNLKRLTVFLQNIVKCKQTVSGGLAEKHALVLNCFVRKQN